MSAIYILTETGDLVLLEDVDGALILESSTPAVARSRYTRTISVAGGFRVYLAGRDWDSGTWDTEHWGGGRLAELHSSLTIFLPRYSQNQPYLNLRTSNRTPIFSAKATFPKLRQVTSE